MFYRYPCIICKFLSSALKDRFSNCPLFPGKLISEAEDAACDFDEEDEVFVSAVMTKYMESKCKRRSSSGAATRLCRCSSATSYNAFFSAKKRFSRSLSWNETGYRDLSKQSDVIQELLQDERWPFGLSKKAILLPPPLKSPSDSWSWRKSARVATSIGRVGEIIDTQTRF